MSQENIYHEVMDEFGDTIAEVFEGERLPSRTKSIVEFFSDDNVFLLRQRKQYETLLSLFFSVFFFSF
tara:strand:+ start:389 stop:592 length:204 start_codon:yes stop_codon:yes gene_type:complete